MRDTAPPPAIFAGAASLDRPAGSRLGPDGGIGAAMVLPAFLVFAVFVLWPVIQTVIGSFQEFSVSSPTRRFVGVSNYVEMATDPVFWRSLWNNVFILVGSVVIQVVLGTLIAAVLDRAIHRFGGVFRTLIFAPMVMSMVAVSLLWSMIYHPVFGMATEAGDFFGLPPSELGILGDPGTVMWAILGVACWQYTGFVMVIVFAGMQSIPEDLYQAAKLDGASAVKRFFAITLPGIRNVVIVSVLLTAIGAFKVFDLIYVLTAGGPGNASEVLGTYIYETSFTLERMGYASAIAVVLLAIAIALGLIQLRASRGGANA